MKRDQRRKTVLKRAIVRGGGGGGGGNNLRSHPPDFEAADDYSVGLRKKRIGVLDV